jgi:hypothetical protein
MFPGFLAHLGLCFFADSGIQANSYEILPRVKRTLPTSALGSHPNVKRAKPLALATGRLRRYVTEVVEEVSLEMGKKE